MLTFLGWLNGVSLVSVLFSQICFGLFFIYKARKTNIKNLKIAGITSCFIGLSHMECSVNFLYYLITNGENLIEVKDIFFLINSTMTILELFFATYLGIELIVTGTKKKPFFLINIILGIIAYIFLVIDLSENFSVFIPPEGSPTEGSMIWIFPSNTRFFLTILVWFCLVIALDCFGCFYKGLRAKGTIRKKYWLLSLATILIGYSQMFSTTTTNFLILSINRYIVVPAGWLFYLALREEKIKKKEDKIKKETTVEGNLFRLYESKPDNITEEEVSISKEKKVCLVCKSSVAGVNYICNICGSYYCIKCYTALSDLENTCWACNEQMDKSKPVKFIREPEENIKINDDK